MDDQEDGLIQKKTDPDRSNAFHMLPHTIEDICTQQSMSTSANTNLFFSPIRHALPQIPFRSSALRMAISKQTHREMFASALGGKQDPSSGQHQLDLSDRDGSAVVNSDESQDQLSLEVGELIPNWKEPQSNKNDNQSQERDPDMGASFHRRRQEQQESPVDSNIATSGFHSSSSSASSASNIDQYLLNSDHHLMDQHLPSFSPSTKESEVRGKGHPAEFMQKIPGINMSSRLDRNSPQMSSMSNFGNPQPSWHAFDFGKGYNDQNNDVVALEQVVQKVNNPINVALHSHHPQVLPSTRSFEPSPNPIKLKIRRDVGAIEQQLQHSPHPNQPPQITPPPSHMPHNRMMLSNHQLSMDFQFHIQQKQLQQQQGPYMYESSHYMPGEKDYYLGGGNGPDIASSSSSSAQKAPGMHFSSEYQDSTPRHMSAYSPEQLSGMPRFSSGQLQHPQHYHNQPQMMNQQLQHQKYQHYQQQQQQQHQMAPQTSSTLSHRPSTPISSAMMVLHGATPSPPIFNCPPQQNSQPPQPSPPSSAAVRPKTGRAKTNAELKKQLMEKRAGQQVRASGDGSSLASSPSLSQIEVESPASSPRSNGSVGLRETTSGGFNNGMEGQPNFVQPDLGTYVELNQEDMQKSNLFWQLGDLVWARVAGHPWWPAMVTLDPITKQFVKVASRGQRNQYHMHFFGDEQERSWVIDMSAVTFAGKAAFHDFCQARLQENKKDRKAYKIPSQHKKAWEASVRSAERAFAMTRLERFARLATLFMPEYKNKRSGRKPNDEDTKKRKSRSDRSSSSDKYAKRMRMDSDLILTGGNVEKNDEGERSFRDDHHHHHQPTESSHIVLPKNVSNQQQAQFTVFCRKKRDVIAQENPTWSAGDIDAHLWQQWSQLDDETRSRFIPMGSDFTYLSRMMQGVDVVGGEAGVAKASAVGKMNGFAGDNNSTARIPVQKKVEETRGRKKANPSSSALKSLSKHDSMLGSKSGNMSSNNQIIDEVCFICEKPDLNVVQCRGPCRGLFHRECIGLNSPSGGKTLPQLIPPANQDSRTDEACPPLDLQIRDASAGEEDDIVCPQCSSKTHKCCECGEILKLTEATTVLCSVTDCGRFYHRACVNIKFFKTPEKLICPLHSCLTCRVRNKVKDSDLILADEEDLDFYECIRCPAAFHIPGVCLATGSKYLAGPFVVCSKHFNPTPKTHPLHARFGATWCFTCEKSGGHMLNCESCPASHHPSCLKISTNPSDLDGWQCPDCIASVNPLHGDVVWVKFGSYRWWPAQIYWPYEVPQNIAELPHEVGEFPVCFFGSRDYLWLNRRRVFPFRPNDKCSREALRKSGGKVFDKAIREAIATFKAIKSDPSSTVCATSNILHLDKKLPQVANDDEDDYDDAEDDDDAKEKTKKRRRKSKVAEKQAPRPSVKRVRGRRESVKESVKSDSDKITNPEESCTSTPAAEKQENVVPEISSGVVMNRSPMAFLSPEIENDLSELRARLKLKKPVDPSLFNKKSLTHTARSTKKVGRDRSKGDSSFSTPSSVVSTLINKPLLQCTSLPGMHDVVCSWCGLEGQSSSESGDDDDDDDEVMNKNIKCEEKETIKVEKMMMSEINNDSKVGANVVKKEEVGHDDDEKDLMIEVRVQDEQNDDDNNEESSPKEKDGDDEKNVIKLEIDDKNNLKCDIINDDMNTPNGEGDKGSIKSDNMKIEDSNNNTLEEKPDLDSSRPVSDSKWENFDGDEPGVREIKSRGSASESSVDAVKKGELRGRARLIFCDKVKCSKVYHYKCLRITKVPHGNWLCPLHQCTICGRASTHQCLKCPNTFCLEHFPLCLSYMDDGSPICIGHPEAPPISKELVSDILEEMAVARDAETSHSTGSLGHRKTSKLREEGIEADDTRADVPLAKTKKRKRSVSTSSSLSSVDRKKKNAKKVKRKKSSEVKDVSFEKRILPSRTQSRDRKFLDDEDSDDGEIKPERQTPIAAKEKNNDLKEFVIPLKERRSHVKEIESGPKKVKKMKGKKEGEVKGEKLKREVEKLSKKEGEQNQTLDDKKSKSDHVNMPDDRVVRLDQKDGDCRPKKVAEVKKHKSKKSEKSNDGGTEKSKEEEKKADGNERVKKKRKKSTSAETVKPRDPKHSTAEENRKQHESTEVGRGGPVSANVSKSPKSAATQETAACLPPIVPPVRPSLLLPPPSSPDKSPMFDNSDDEFPELVIDVPM